MTARRGSGVALALLVAVLSAPAQERLAVRAKTLHTMAGPAITNGVVLIASGRIEKVGPASAVPIPAGYRILAAEVGSLEGIRQIVRLTGFVCSAEGFTEQANVVNGASELMSQVLEARGVHARLAVGVAELPLGAAVELEVIAQVE